MSTSSILKEQPDKNVAIKHIAVLLQRLGKLYQVPSWSEENAILLAQWIFDNYKFEQLETINKCLYNPPKTDSKNWRLTPDTIQEWMAIVLEDEAERREYEHQKLKQLELVAPMYLPDFDQLFKGTWFDEAKHEEEYEINKLSEIRENWKQGKIEGYNKDAEVQAKLNQLPI